MRNKKYIPAREIEEKVGLSSKVVDKSKKSKEYRKNVAEKSYDDIDTSSEYGLLITKDEKEFDEKDLTEVNGLDEINNNDPIDFNETLLETLKREIHSLKTKQAEIKSKCLKELTQLDEEIDNKLLAIGKLVMEINDEQSGDDFI